jgi:hypothetical protein
VRDHRGFHSRAAHLVDRRAARRVRKSRGERSLARRGLTLTRGEDVAHDDFVDFVRRDPRALNRGAYCGSTEVARGQRFERALKAAHRGAGGGSDND